MTAVRRPVRAAQVLIEPRVIQYFTNEGRTNHDETLNLGRAGCAAPHRVAGAGVWEPPTFPDQDDPAWNLNGDPANAVITQDGFLRVDAGADSNLYHVYQLLGQSAIDAGAGFETATSAAWRCRIVETSPLLDWTTSFAVYAPSPTLSGKSDLYVVRIRGDGVGAGWPAGSINWYELDTTQWHNYQMDINPATQSGELTVDGVSFGSFPVYTAGIPIDPYQGIRFSDQGKQSAGIVDWAYVGWGEDGQVPTETYPDAIGTTVVPYTPNPVIEGNFKPIVLPEDGANGNRQASHVAYANFPTGDLEYYGVPFTIPAEGDNYWDSRYDANGAAVADGELNSITVDVNEYGVIDVYTIINTYVGKIEGDPVVSIVFEATDGMIYEKELAGNRDIRDAGYPGTTTTLNPLYAVNAWTESGTNRRIDMQMISLPDEFATKTLASVTLKDWGRMTYGEGEDNYRQRSWLYGMTVSVVPEPSVLLMAFLGATLCAWRRR